MEVSIGRTSLQVDRIFLDLRSFLENPCVRKKRVNRDSRHGFSRDSRPNREVISVER